MELVIDANVLLAGILKDALTRELILDSRLKLMAPEYLILETLHLVRKNTRLQKRAGLPARALEENLNLLIQNIETYPRQVYVASLQEAFRIAPHKEDAPYLALAIALNISVWSNDRGIHAQNRVKVYTTGELLASLRKR
ncbi:MAG: PIN domain-containing protein [Candidatus Omnitrophica bacterium]|nr:PIN domain-containing protein [Candidatus Omnitrophota bacterium]